MIADLATESASTITDDVGTVNGPTLVAAGRELARAWSERGMVPGSRVGLWLPNSRRYLEALLACALGRFVAVSVNTLWAEAEAESLLQRSGARLLRTADGDVDLPGETTPLKATSDDDPYVVFTTSGTTGQPKMVLHGQRSICVHSGHAARQFGYRPDTPILVVMPLCGVFGFTSFFTALAAGAPIFLPSGVDVDEMAATVERERIWSINGSDDLFHRLLDTTADLSSLQACGYARFNSSLDGIVERAAARGVTMTGVYGMSEVQALYTIRDPSLPVGQRRRAGGTVVSETAAARVVDDELQLRGPSLFSGYLSEGGGSVDRSLTDGAFDDGWFCTGDAAVMDESVDGYSTFHYTARLGDALRLGGFLVAPSEIESELLSYPGITAAQVVAVDLPTGSRPVAFVLGVFSDDEPLDEADAIAHCRRRLAVFKCPVRVIVLDDFPTTPSANGTKIQKAKLRDLAVAAVGRSSAKYDTA